MLCERLASPVRDGDRGMTPPWNVDRKSRLSALNGPSRESMPSIAFRLGLALRRCGEVDEADAYFSWSRRLMAERYVAARICEHRRFVLDDDSAAEPAVPESHAA
jgi:hypothetical protein